MTDTTTHRRSRIGPLVALAGTAGMAVALLAATGHPIIGNRHAPQTQPDGRPSAGTSVAAPPQGARRDYYRVTVLCEPMDRPSGVVMQMAISRLPVMGPLTTNRCPPWTTAFSTLPGAEVLFSASQSVNGRLTCIIVHLPDGNIVDANWRTTAGAIRCHVPPI